ncbi:MAG: hypothetical protein IJV68_02985 [Clostridia bacterium]|nr:hypothetical protein [Clostridia bacterium]
MSVQVHSVPGHGKIEKPGYGGYAYRKDVEVQHPDAEPGSPIHLVFLDKLHEAFYPGYNRVYHAEGEFFSQLQRLTFLSPDVTFFLHKEPKHKSADGDQRERGKHIERNIVKNIGKLIQISYEILFRYEHIPILLPYDFKLFPAVR